MSKSINILCHGVRIQISEYRLVRLLPLQDRLFVVIREREVRLAFKFFFRLNEKRIVPFLPLFRTVS